MQSNPIVVDGVLYATTPTLRVIALNMVFAATGSAAFDCHGANRHGDNLFANSVIALDARTGTRAWHFQTTRHDVWDMDLPSPPALVTVTRNVRSMPSRRSPRPASCSSRPSHRCSAFSHRVPELPGVEASGRTGQRDATDSARPGTSRATPRDL
jgi:hypothetical protein